MWHLTLYSLPNPINLVNFFLAWFFFFFKFQKCSPCLLSLGTERSSFLRHLLTRIENCSIVESLPYWGPDPKTKEHTKWSLFPRLNVLKHWYHVWGSQDLKDPESGKHEPWTFVNSIKFQLSLPNLGTSLFVDLSNYSWDTWESSWWHGGHPKNVFSMTSWEWMLNDRFSPLFQRNKVNFWLLA